MSKRRNEAWRPQNKRMLKHWKVLCEDIGERRAGTRGEASAARYIRDQLALSALKDCKLEHFPCTSLKHSRVELNVRTRKGLTRIPARAIVGAPSTQSGAERETELVWIEMPEQAQRLFTRDLEGKIAVLFGPLPTHVDLHKKMVSLRPAAVIHIDDRLPFEWLKDDGVYPYWVKKFGMPPTVAIPYRVAWELKKQGVSRAKLCVAVSQEESASQNVSGELPGRDPALPCLVVSAHHDTQCNNTGADDNASGVIAVLELASLLSKRKLLRTVRFLSFGTEEQLSVGAAHYVQEHARELPRIGTVLNMDGLSSVLGHNFVLTAGRPQFGKHVLRVLSEHGLDATESKDSFPFGDHFPFSVYDIPCITVSRPNMHSFMRWQHHSAYDNLQEVSIDETAKAVAAMAALVEDLANAREWPFQRGLDQQQRTLTLQYARDLYGFEV